MKMKKQYEKAEAEILRLDVKDIITVSGFFGTEVSFRAKRNSSSATKSAD